MVGYSLKDHKESDMTKVTNTNTLSRRDKVLTTDWKYKKLNYLPGIKSDSTKKLDILMV